MGSAGSGGVLQEKCENLVIWKTLLTLAIWRIKRSSRMMYQKYLGAFDRDVSLRFSTFFEVMEQTKPVCLEFLADLICSISGRTRWQLQRLQRR